MIKRMKALFRQDLTEMESVSRWSGEWERRIPRMCKAVSRKLLSGVETTGRTHLKETKPRHCFVK